MHGQISIILLSVSKAEHCAELQQSRFDMLDGVADVLF